MAEFRRAFSLPAKGCRVKVDVCADTRFQLYVNDEFIGAGPLCPGGDYDFRIPMAKRYLNHYEFVAQGAEIRFLARVQLSPTQMTDVSWGQGGLILWGEARTDTGEVIAFQTDPTWEARLNPAWRGPETVDFTLPPPAWEPAAEVQCAGELCVCPIPMLEESDISLGECWDVPGETLALEFPLPQIHAAFVGFELETEALCEIEFHTWELPGQDPVTETIRTDHSIAYRSLNMKSVGGLSLRVRRLKPGRIHLRRLTVIDSRYPGEVEGRFLCSDEGLNLVYRVAQWTLGICRQWIHLDSPKHQENLGCTGDYYIESLMSYVSYRDTRLVRFDIARTAEWLRLRDGQMFHTSYSLIWVRMMRDYVGFTGDKRIFAETEDALRLLLGRFESYLGETGLLEHAPNYMFVDWGEVDGYSLHHPPMALGQTCLNALYFDALSMAAELYEMAGNAGEADLLRRKAQSLQKAVDRWLWDAQRGLYVGGLNGPVQPNNWMPPNASGQYFIQQANILCVFSGLCEGKRAREVMETVMTDATLPDIQPYFAHFQLEALKRVELMEKYGMKVLRRWIPLVKNCAKGLQEGWNAPGADYQFDHSHAWGGTPVYQLPCCLLGLKILEPGCAHIRLSPCLLGLEWAKIAMPTPLGILECELRRHQAPILRAPKGMKVEIALEESDGPRHHGYSNE